MKRIKRAMARRRVRLDIESLGHSSDDIAANLAVLGIKGTRRTARNCPIACFLKLRHGGTWFVHVGKMIGGSVGVIEQSDAMRAFIVRFDRGHFSYLEVPG